MFIRSRIIGLVLGLVFVVTSAWAAGSAIQGDVKGPDGKPLKGAEVRLERKDAKSALTTVKTDQQGRYAFKNLAVGAYTVSATANGMAPTALEKVKAREEGATRVDFNLKQQTGSAQSAAPAKKKAKQMVWVASPTGSNIGGRWVEVGTSTADSETIKVKRTGAGAIKSAQSADGGSSAGEGN